MGKNGKALMIFACLLVTFCGFAQEKKWELVWADEFNESALDSNKWNYHHGPVYNNELQHYKPRRPDNVRIENGALVIEAHKEDDGYTSGSINTKGLFAFKYGKIEVAAILPQGRGVWPAIWMMPEISTYGGWPRSGEIDIMEFVGHEPGIIHTTVHTEAFNHTKKTEPVKPVKVNCLHTQYNIFGMEWDENEICFYVNNVQVNRFARQGNGSDVWPFDNRFYILLNIAVGGDWGGLKGVDDTIFPQRMTIDYVRVFKQMNQLSQENTH